MLLKYEKDTLKSVTSREEISAQNLEMTLTFIFSSINKTMMVKLMTFEFSDNSFINLNGFIVFL